MSDDDFKSVKPGCNSAGSPKRKVGTEVVLFVESRWKGSELVDQLLSYFETLSSYYPDIEFPDIGQTKGLSMLILTETNYLGQTSTFKQRVAKFYGLRKNHRTIVFCVRTLLSSPDFLQVQLFVSVEIGLTLIPVADLNKIPQLVGQLYQVEKGARGNVNPFKFGCELRQMSNPYTQHLASLMSIPGLGEKKAKALIESGRFHTLMELSEASLDDLRAVLDASSAKSLHTFFNLEN